MKRLVLKIGFGRLAGFGFLILLVILRNLDPTPIETVRNQAFDLYQRIKPRAYTRLPVAIIDIDEASIKKHGQWPWPRTKVADLVVKAAQLGVVATAFDIVFAEGDRLSPALFAADNPTLPDALRAALKALPSNDKLFADAIRSTRVVVGQTSVRSQSDNTEDRKEMAEVPHAFLGPNPIPYLRKFQDIVQNLPEFEAAAQGYGVFTVEPDEDGVFRQFPLVMMVQDKIRLSLSAELLRVATGGSAFAIKTNDAGIFEVVIGGQSIQTDQNGAVWPYFSQSLPTRYVSAGDILDGKVPANRLRGHLTLVGTSAVGLEDYRATPMGYQMAGVEIHAQIIENVLAKQMLVRPNYAIAIEFTTIVVLGLLAIVLVPMLNAIWSFICGGVLVAGYVGFSYSAFDQSRLLIDPTFPVISTTLLFMVLATANYFAEEKKRREIKGAFGQYVSPDLVERLSNEPDALTLGGETRELTVLFSDVRGFTAISESYKHNPQGLTQLMNLFLTALSRPILNRSGTIDKFMGDAVMAFWNAPLDQADHGINASLAAVEMLEEVASLNKRMLAERDAEIAEHGEASGTYHEINVGIGINTGPCVVGNMGSDNRFDYTALGDTVNMASRLEGQSKPYGIGIVIGHNTAKLIEDKLPIFEIDLIRVKGKLEPEKIFGLFGREELLTNPDFIAARAMNRTMISSYRSQDWESAFSGLEMLRELEGRLELGIDDYLFIYETRIAEFRANPPGRDWTGVYTALSK